MIVELFNKAINLTNTGMFGVSLDIILEHGEVIGVDIWVNVKIGYIVEEEHISCHSLESAYAELTFLETKLNK